MSAPHRPGARALALLALVVAGLLLAGPARASERATPDLQVAGFDVFVHYGDADGRPELWEALPQRIERIRSELGDTVLRAGEIHVLARLNDYWEERGEPGRAPRWAQALAIPSRRLILLRFPDPDPIATLTHELSHLAVHEAAGGEHVPYWFLEGYAMHQADELDLGKGVALSMAALFGNTLDFNDLDRSFPPHDQIASLAYAQSFHFVDRLLERFGNQPVRQWLGQIAEGVPWRDAYRASFGESFAQSARDWREGVKVWYAWIPALVSATTLWTLLALLVLWGRRRVRARRGRRLAAMAAAERGLYAPDPDDDLFT